MLPDIPIDVQSREPGDLLQALCDQFDSDRARQVVVVLCSDAFAGRRVGTTGHDAAQAWLAQQLRGIGLETTIFPFTLEVPVLDMYALPSLSILKDTGEIYRDLRHRTEFTAHPRSADTPIPLSGVAHRVKVVDAMALLDEAAASRIARLAPAAGAWLILDAVPQGETLEIFATQCAAKGVIGLLVPQVPNADGYLVKRIVGQRPIALPMLAVRADLLPTLDGQRISASAPIRPARAAGGHVLGLLPGSDPAVAMAPLIISAHYDGVGDDGPAGAGGDRLQCATDNAAGVAVILEVARLLKVRVEHPHRPIVFAMLDAEEVNAGGSRAYASALRTQGIAPLVVNLDGAARLHDALVVEPGQGADMIVEALDQAGQYLELPLTVGAVSSDNRRFAAAGFAAVGVSVGLSGLHTPADSLVRVEREAMRQSGRLLLATIWHLAYSG